MIQAHLHDLQSHNWFAPRKVRANSRVAAGTLGIWASIVILAMSLPVRAARAEGYMFGRASFGVGSTGTGPASVAVGDFNGDGMIDLAVVQPSRNSVAILLGKVDGTLAPATYYATGKQPVTVAVGDFNGDGRLDLAVGNQNCTSTSYCGANGSVSILLGNGDGTFQTQIVNAFGTQPIALAGGDFNGDGNLDLVVSNQATNSLMVLLGDGDGTFQPGAHYTMSSPAVWVAAGDLNADGHLDLAVATSNGPVAIFIGNGDGTFARAGDMLVLPDPNAVALGDFNGDGVPDLAVTYAGQAVVSILLGKGDGSFQPRSDYSAGTYPAALSLADLNGDGHLDVAVANGAGQSISILLGKGDGSFEPAREYLLPGTPTALGVGDFNRDGKPDFAVVMSGLGVLSVVLGRGDGSFSNPTAFGDSLGSWSIATGDFDGDGKLDLVTTNLVDNSISLFRGDGLGSFQVGFLASAPAVPVAAVAGDFNRDGKLDVAVVSQLCTSLPCSPGSLSMFLGYGDGTLAPGTNYNIGSIPVAVAAGDFNGDGVTDLAVVNNGFGFANTLSILLGRGDGTFLDGGTLVTGNGPSQAVAADFNGDGFTDLAVTYSAGISIFPGRGAGTFGPRTDYALSSPARAIATGDFNHDGKPDLAVTAGSSVLIYIGKGDGAFLPGPSYPIASVTTLQSLIVGDFDGDGKPDLLVGKSNNAVAILVGVGDGTFLAPVDVAAGKSERGWVAGDFDGDGGLDFAAASVGSNAIFVVLNSPAMAVYPAGIDFGAAGVGEASAPRLVTISNPSGAPLEITAVTASGGFTVSSGCPSTLAAGANCRLSVVASPTGAGDSAGVLTISDNAPGSPQYVALHGTGVNVPEVSTSPVTLTFAPQNVGSTSAAMTVTLTNRGTAVLNIAVISASGDFAAADTCLPALSAGAGCTITVTFTPSAAGARSGILTITDNAASSPQTVGLTGTGVAKPVAALSVANLAFGNQRVNTTSSAESVTLRNSGNATLNISSIDPTSGFTASSTCPAALAAGANCTLSVSFTPTATGSVVGSLTLTDDGDGGSQTVTLTGTGTAPQAALSAASVAFSRQMLGKTSTAQTVTLSNPGTAPLAINNVTLGGTASGDFALQSLCGGSLDPGANCVISVTFTPAQMWPRNATLSIATNAVGSPSSVTLTGTGTAPQASLSVLSLTFGSQMLGKAGSAQSVMLSNPGTAPLTISSVALGGSASGDFALQNPCGGSLDPGANCVLSATFTPAAVGPRNAVMSIATNAADSPSSVTLTGTGIAPQVALAPSTVSFTAQMLGNAGSAQPVTLSNPGTAPLTIGSATIGGAASGDFTIQNQCGASLDPGAACTIGVIFTPGAVGTRNAVLSVTTNVVGSQPSVTLAGTGADFSLIPPSGAGNTLTVAPGQVGQFQMTLIPGGMQGAASFTCAGAPSNATCQVSPGAASLDGVNPVSLSISVATTAPSIVVFQTPPVPWTSGMYRLLVGMLMLLGLGLMAYLTAGGFEKRTGWGLATLTLGAALSIGCGGGGQAISAPHVSQPGTPAGTYALTVTASSHGISHALSYTLTVKN